MPKPIYIICSESIAQDRETNVLSLFNIIERFVVTPGAAIVDNDTGMPVVSLISFRVIAVWMGTEDDRDVQYESQMILHHPNDPGKDMTVDAGKFVFGPA